MGTYFTCSLLFWYVGLIPDLATLRDRAKTKIRKIVFGILSLGWRGGNRQWKHYELAYLILAGISTPLVLVGSLDGLDRLCRTRSFRAGTRLSSRPILLPALFSPDLRMVMTLAMIARKVFNLENFITLNHLEKMNKIMLVTGMMVGYAYACEIFHRLVFGQSVRAVHVYQPCLRAVRVGVLDDGLLQRDRAAALLV